MTTANDIEWVPFKEAWRIATKNAIDVSQHTFRKWVEGQKYGIISGTFGGQIVVRKDSIPKVIEKQAVATNNTN